MVHLESTRLLNFYDCVDLLRGYSRSLLLISLVVCISFSAAQSTSCNPNPCKVAGICLPLGPINFTCLCPAGFRGELCEIEEIDICDPNPCEENGICIPTNRTNFFCVCPLGVAGKTCEIEIDDCQPNPCDNGGTCEDERNDFTCRCPLGYSGKTCEDAEFCAITEFCFNGGTCMVQGEGDQSHVTCNCPPSYTGVLCEIKAAEEVSMAGDAVTEAVTSLDPAVPNRTQATGETRSVSDGMTMAVTSLETSEIDEALSTSGAMMVSEVLTVQSSSLETSEVDQTLVTATRGMMMVTDVITMEATSIETSEMGQTQETADMMMVGDVITVEATSLATTDINQTQATKGMMMESDVATVKQPSFETSVTDQTQEPGGTMMVTDVNTAKATSLETLEIDQTQGPGSMMVGDDELLGTTALEREGTEKTLTVTSVMFVTDVITVEGTSLETSETEQAQGTGGMIMVSDDTVVGATLLKTEVLDNTQTSIDVTMRSETSPIPNTTSPTQALQCFECNNVAECIANDVPLVTCQPGQVCIAVNISIGSDPENTLPFLRRGCEDMLTGDRMCLSSSDYLSLRRETLPVAVEGVPTSGRACLCGSDACNTNARAQDIETLILRLTPSGSTDSLKIEWFVVDRNQDIDGFYVEVQMEGSEEWVKVSPFLPADEREFFIDSLTGVTRIRVIAVDQSKYEVAESISTPVRRVESGTTKSSESTLGSVLSIILTCSLIIVVIGVLTAVVIKSKLGRNLKLLFQNRSTMAADTLYSTRK